MYPKLLLAIVLTTGCNSKVEGGDTSSQTDTSATTTTDTGSETSVSTTDTGEITGGGTSEETQDTEITTDTATDTDTDTDTTVNTPDLSFPGPYNVLTTSESVVLSDSCTTDTITNMPEGAPDAPHVILSHGFSRNQGNMVDMAAHWASWGVPVSTVTLCHNWLLNNDPDLDAVDLVSFSDYLGGGPVIYAGHSAGGVRSVMAGALDVETVAILGLDLVDYAEDFFGENYIGQTTAPSVNVPIFGVHGENTDCNGSDIGLGVYDVARNSVALRITDADHCDFESPTDILCTALCQGSNNSFTEEEIADTILNLTTAFLLWQTGLDPQGEEFWTEGEAAYEALVNMGAVTVP